MYIKKSDLNEIAAQVSIHYDIELEQADLLIEYLNDSRPGQRVLKAAHRGQYDDDSFILAADFAGVRLNNVTIPGAPDIDIIPNEFDGLPDGVVQAIKDQIQLFCDSNGVEDMRKAPADVWAACCIAIGYYIKRNRIAKDNDKSHNENDPDKVNALIDLYGELCSLYSKPPLIYDFCKFAGVSYEYITGETYDKRKSYELTSACLEMNKKLKKMQESSLTRRLADGRQNPTGSIFILKNLHGWRDERSVEHIQGATSVPIGDLPKFNTGAIEEKA
jgi:hypothetical protein